MHTTPHALVLGGGGVVGEAWMSAVLAGLDEAEGFDSRACAGYVGTSAGSIVAAALAPGAGPRRRVGPAARRAGVDGCRRRPSGDRAAPGLRRGGRPGRHGRGPARRARAALD